MWKWANFLHPPMLSVTWYETCSNFTVSRKFFASIIFSGLYKAFTKCIMLSWCHFAWCSKMSGLQMPSRNFTNIWLTQCEKKKKRKENRIIVGALNIWLKERFLSKVTYRYRPRDCHTEWSKSDRERQISYAITYMWNLKAGYKWTYLQNRNRVIECRKQAYGCCFCSVSKLCITLCEPMDCSTPGFLVPHLLPESAQLHVHWTSDDTQPSHLLSPSSPSSFNLSQHQALFHWVGCLYQVARVWELQLQHQHQSFQWVFRVDSL